MSKRCVRHGLLALLVWAACFLPPVWSADDAALPPHLDSLRRQALHHEEQGQWGRACELYEQILSRDRQQARIKDRYLTCLRRAQQARRLQDASYRQQVLTLALSRAVDAYGEVLSRLQNSYVERDRVDLVRLYQQGIEELCLALDDATLQQQYLPGVPRDAIQGFQQELRTTWASRSPRRLLDAQMLARELALGAQQRLGLRSTLAVLELSSGACNALDEYTSFLTPGQLRDVYDTLRGQLVGVGIEVHVEADRLIVGQVVPGSPADLAGIRAGERLTRIGQRPTAQLPAEAAAELLRGSAGTSVDLEVESAVQGLRPLRLTRQALRLASVSEPRLLGDRTLPIGYVQVLGFQETTLQELDEAIQKLQAAGMKALLLDLRGNPGGLVDVAVQTAQRFLPEGVIASTQGQLRLYNRTYEAHNPAALATPLVVLIDGETASSAEMVAGALRDNQRGRLVGQTTFGKGSIQHYWRLSTTAGLRITVAKFYSPRGQPYSGQGVTPHLVVERPWMLMSLDLEQDPQVRAALETARRLVLDR